MDISLTGTATVAADSADVEQAIVDKARELLGNIAGKDGLTVTSASFTGPTLGVVDLLAAPVETPLETAVDELATAINAVDVGSASDVTVTAAQWAALVKAANDVEAAAATAAPAPPASSPSSAPAPAPVLGVDASPETAAVEAASKVLPSGEAVAL